MRNDYTDGNIDLNTDWILSWSEATGKKLLPVFDKGGGYCVCVGWGEQKLVFGANGGGTRDDTVDAGGGRETCSTIASS